MRQTRKKSPVFGVFLVLMLLTGIAFVAYNFLDIGKSNEAPVPAKTFSSKDVDTYSGPEAENINLESLEGINGAATYIESLGIVSPMISTDAMPNGFLELPNPPLSTWYKSSANFGSKVGKSVVASHVDFGYGDLAPFGELHRIEKGAPVIIQDSDNVKRSYTVDSIDLYSRKSIPKEHFQTNGDKKLVLITCSGPSITDDDLPYYEYNLVVEASFDKIID